MDGAQKKWIENYFDNELLPILTPIGLDPSHPFPRPLNKSLNFAVELEGTDAFGVVRDGDCAGSAAFCRASSPCRLKFAAVMQALCSCLRFCMPMSANSFPV